MHPTPNQLEWGSRCSESRVRQGREFDLLSLWPLKERNLVSLSFSQVLVDVEQSHKGEEHAHGAPEVPGVVDVEKVHVDAVFVEVARLCRAQRPVGIFLDERQEGEDARPDAQQGEEAAQGQQLHRLTPGPGAELLGHDEKGQVEHQIQPQDGENVDGQGRRRFLKRLTRSTRAGLDDTIQRFCLIHLVQEEDQHQLGANVGSSKHQCKGQPAEFHLNGIQR